MADLIGDNNDNTLTGTAGPDTFQGNGGDDTLIAGPSGSDTINGGAGADTLVLIGSFASYAIGYSGGNLILTNGATVETVTGVERINFADKVVRVVGNGSEFATIQAAVNAAANGDIILIQPGTYAEQVTVDGKSGLTIMAAPGGTVTIQAPADVVQTATSSSGREVHAVVEVLNSTDIRLDNINVDGAGVGDTISGANPSFVGVHYRNASGSLVNTDVTGVRHPYEPGTTPGGHAILNATRTGIGVQVDNDAQLAFAMTGGSISDFQANATAFSNAILNVNGVTVTGGGDQTLIQQNGLQAGGCSGVITGNTITGIGFAGVTFYASGIVAFLNTNLAITNNTITGSNIDNISAQVVGIYLQDSSDNVTVTGNIISHVDEGVTLSGDVTAGGVAVNSNTVTNLDTLDPSAWGLLMVPNLAAVGPVNAVGTGFNDAIVGGAAGDSFVGGAGNDYIDGGLGADSMLGGTDQDQYFVDNAGDSVIENPLEGFDLVNSSINYTLGANVEDLTLTGFDNLSGTGNALVNVIRGNFGNNILNGGAAADTLFGGDGDDQFYLGADAADDTVAGDSGVGDIVDLYYASGATTVTFGATAFAGTATGGGIGIDSFAGIERVYGSTFKDTVNGGADGEYFYTRAGDDIVNAGGGNDLVYGDLDNDTLRGGTGIDTLHGGSGDDLIYLDADAVIDSVVGDLGAADILDLFYATSGATVNFGGVAFAGTAAGGGLGTDSFTGIERIYGSTTADTVNGGSGAEYLYTRAGNDIVNAGGGNDLVYGDLGNDTLRDGAGSDYLQGGANDDRLYVDADGVSDTVAGDIGTADALDLYYATAATTVTFGATAFAGTASGGGQGTTTFTGIERIYGSTLVDTVTGGAAAEYLYLRGGSDAVSSGGGNDIIYADAGNDYVNAGANDDFIEGGAGNDGLTGGTGLDTFDFNLGSGTDTVYDFSNDQDTLRIDPGYGFANAATVVAATTASGNNAVIQLSGGFGIFLVGYLAANSIASLADDIVIG